MGAAIVAAGTYAAANAATIATVVSVATAAASSGIAYKNSQEQKASQEAYNKALEKDAIRQYGELDKMESDVVHESYAESMQAQREYLQARSSVELQAAVSGTYGNSINLAIQDLNTGLGGRMADITYKRESQLDAIDRKAEDIQAAPAMGADTSIQMPSYYSAFSSGMNTFQSMSSIGRDVARSYSSGTQAIK